MNNMFWFLRERGTKLAFSLIVIGVLAVTIGVPLLVAILWSLVDPEAGWHYPNVLPPRLSLHFWRWAATQPGIGRAALLTFMIAPLVTVTCAVLALPTGYALGRYRFRAKRLIEAFLLAPVMVPSAAVAVSLTAIFIRLHLSQTVLGIMLAHTVVYLPYMIRTVAAAFSAIPQDVIEAARNLEANPLQLTYYVLVPLVMPGILAGAVFTFIFSVEEFVLAFIIGAPTIQTLPVILYRYLGDQFIRSSASVVSLMILVPTLAVLFITERFLRTEYVAAGFGKL